MADKSTLQSILENVRDAAVGFGRRFAPASNIRPELTKLLAELGINDPAHSVSDALASAAAGWKSIADSLSAVSLDFTDPAAILQGIKDRGKQIDEGLDKILHAPDTALDGLGATGAAIKAVFPTRLLDYIAYEFITKSHQKIGGALQIRLSAYSWARENHVPLACLCVNMLLSDTWNPYRSLSPFGILEREWMFSLCSEMSLFGM